MRTWEEVWQIYHRPLATGESRETEGLSSGRWSVSREGKLPEGQLTRLSSQPHILASS